MFMTVFLSVLAAMIASQLVGWIVFAIWWHEPHKTIKKRYRKWRARNEPKPQATYRDNVVDFKENHNA